MFTVATTTRVALTIMVVAGFVLTIACNRSRQNSQPRPPPPYAYGPPPPQYGPPHYGPPYQPPSQPQPQPQPQSLLPPPNPLLDMLGQLLKSGPPAPWQLPPLPTVWPFPAMPPPSTPLPPSTPPPGVPPPAVPGISARSLDLANTINNYRVQNGLPAVPISKSLTHVAETHARDLRDSPSVPPSCNAHSWTNKGPWSPCCYTADHAQSKCMWEKPAELTPFKATGFEIAIGVPGQVAGYVLNSQNALELWKGSPLHHEVILNRGTWEKTTWRAMGAGIVDSHACVWFADQVDPVP